MCVTAHWAYQCPIFNWSASVHLHFALECSLVFTYLYMAHGCAKPSIMFYQHICTAFCLWNYLNYLSFWIITVTFIFIYSNSNSNIVYLTSTSIQHVWQRTRDWRSYTSTVGRLKLRYRSTAITKATQQGMRSHTIWLNDVAGCGITCWKSCFLPLSKEYSDMSIRWSFE